MASATGSPSEPLPLSLLNDYFYCPRRAALKLVEGWREANEHTARGDIVHEHTDLRGYEVKAGVTVLRALPVFSERLGLNGKCDIVEAEGALIADINSRFSNLQSLRPVEFKLGKRRQWVNDDAQLCAQALCLEEMFGVAVPRGAVFHADSKRRREVEFTAELRVLTEGAVGDLRALLGGSHVSNLECETPTLPPAEFKPACAKCSLYEICLPQVTSQPARVERARRTLFEI